MRPGSTVAEVLAAVAGARGAAGLARLEGERLRLIEGTCESVGALALGPLLQQGEPAWAVTKRMSTGWTLWLGCRPERVATVRIGSGDWVLVAAQPAAAEPGLSLHAAAVALAQLWREGATARADRARRDLAEALVQALASAVVHVGGDGESVIQNAAAEALLGLAGAASKPRPDQVVEALQRMLADSGLAPAQREALAAAGVEGCAAEIELAERVLMVHSRRLGRGDGGRIWQFVDITTLRQRERALYESIRAETVARLAAGVAHQFNNLLTVLLGEAESLQLDASLPASLRARAGGMLAAAERGAELVAQLQAYAQVRPRQRVALRLEQELDQLLPILRRTLGKGIDVRYSRGQAWPEEARVDCDRGLLLDSIVNIAINAGQAMPQGGRLEIGLEPVVAGPAEGTQRALPESARGWARLAFVDEGPGMSTEVLRRAREPFFTTRGLASARGLGLAVAEGFAQASGGLLALRSGPGGGCRVELWLPYR